jgi:phospholipase C
MTGSRPPIDHIVVLMMENHCFDRMLGCMREIHPGLEGVDPAHPHSNPDVPSGAPIRQQPTHTRNIDRDPRHELDQTQRQIDGGTLQGFVADFVRTHPHSTPEERQEVMAYYPRGFLPALHTLAENFVICDHWFSSLPGPTWINRLFAHSGTSLGHIEEPEDLFNPNLHIYDQPTLYTELSRAGVSWRIYHGDVPQTLVLLQQWEHLGNYRGFGHWQRDVAAGDLPAYTFIEPAYFPPRQNDQHPPHDIMRGDALIATVYNTLLGNPDLFERTLLIVLYDEHGGFFDHVVPPPTVPPDDHTQRYGFDQLGLRVPAVLVSPLLDPGFTRTVFDHTSLLRMASEHWPGVRPLGRRAAQANSPLGAVRWRESVRQDLPRAPVAPDIQRARYSAGVRGFSRSLYRFTEEIEQRTLDGLFRRIVLTPLRRWLHTSHGQGHLATRRVDRFIANGSGGPGQT